MNTLIIDSGRLNAYQDLMLLCEYAGRDKAFGEELWLEFLADDALFQEFVFYLKNQTLGSELKVEGYSMLDLYVKQIELDNLRRDTGKSTFSCNKGGMILDAFCTMAHLRHNPEDASVIMSDDFKNDKL